MIKTIILSIALLVCLCVPSDAQNIYDDTTNEQIHLKHSWGDSNNEDDKSLSMEPTVYNGKKSLIIHLEHPSSNYELYITSLRGKVVLYQSLSNSSTNMYTITLQGIRLGMYTLYLYEGDRFWYGSFTIER